MTDMITSRGVRGEITQMWQRAYTLNTDRVFHMPYAQEVRKVVAETKVVTLKVVDNLNECDDISIILWGKVKEARAQQALLNQIPPAEQLSWPLGICFGTCFNGWSASHWQNLCLTRDEGILMIEAQTENFWPPSYPDDDVRFVLI